MAEMRDIVRSRLARKTSGISAHPDANLLAAFTESALAERERAGVVAHLAECADCRELVALASGAADAEPVVGARIASTGFRNWFREYRWIVSSAMACCVVAAVLVHYGEPPARVSFVSVSSKLAEPRIGDSLKTVPATPVPPAVAHKRKVEAVPSDKTQPPVVMASKKSVALDLLTQPPPAQPPPETALRVSRLEPPQADTNFPLSLVEPERAAAAPLSQSPRPAAAKQFGEQAALAGRAPSFAPRLQAAGPTSLRPVASDARILWSINASPDTVGKLRGVVERSRDAGQSWEAVPLSERVSFRAVATLGSDVWAGGSAAVLFHSADGGSRWAEIKIADENGSVSSDIVKIEVRGPHRLTVTTASGEVWISVDDGKHWARE